MYKEKSVSLIIPCLNEEEGLKKILPQIPLFVDEIIVVDNGSEDKSLETIKNLHDKRIKIIEEKSRGYGRTLKSGILASQSDFILAIDGDGSYLPSDIEKLVAEISKNNLDFVWGTRFPLKNKISLPSINLLGNKILSFFTNILFGLKIKDSQSGMWAIKHEAPRKLNLTQKGMAFSEEIKVEAVIKNLKYKEVPIGYQKRVGKSKLSVIKDGFLNFIFLFRKKLTLREKIDRKLLAESFAVGLFVFLALGAIGFSSNGFLDPDTFFHARLSSEVANRGFAVFSQLPWLSYMPGFIDSNFLYHLFLSFFANFDLLFVYKLFGIITASFIFMAFFLILKKHRVRLSFFWILILLSSGYFSFRLLLFFRPFLISIIFIILSFYFVSKRKAIKFFILSVFYPLLYVMPFSVFIALIFLLVEFIKEKTIRLKFLGISLLGTTIGFLINPSFPKNINFMFVQTFRSLTINNAGELQPLDWFSFVSGNFLIYLTIVGIITILIYKRRGGIKNLSIESMAALMLFVVFFALTIRFQRFLEYWVPFTVLAGALVARDFEIDKKFINFLKGIFRQGSEPWRNNRLLKLAKFLPISAVCLFIFMIFLNSIAGNYLALKNTPPYDRYKPAAEWLIQNTPEKSIVFNVAWDDFPELFFWNTHNYYIVGMDPTFMYEYDKNLYEKYRKIADGEDSAPSKTIKNYFNSTTIFVNKEKNPKFIETASADPALEKSYQDHWSTIYKIKN